MRMVSKGDDQHGEDLLVEKRSLELLVTLRLPYGDEEIRARRGIEEQERNMFMIDSATTKTLLESKKRRVVSDEVIRAEPIREIKPSVREKNRAVRKKGPVRREPGVTPGWVVDLMREKKGVNVKMIIEKKLKASDIKEGLSRLLMPFNQMAEMDFLNETELTIIEEHYIKIFNKGVDVLLVDSSGEEWNLNLRRWDMKTSSNYVLCTGWKDVVRHHKLKKDQIIRLWSFHSQDGNKLYFAFAPSTPAPDLVQDMAQPQAQDLAQAMTQPQTQDLALSLAIPAALSSSMTPVITRGSDELFPCEETNRILFPFPKRRRTSRVCVPAPTRDSSNLGQSILESLDLNRTVPQVCKEMAPLEAVQETNWRTSLVSVTDTSQVFDTETMTLDLELRL